MEMMPGENRKEDTGSPGENGKEDTGSPGEIGKEDTGSPGSSEQNAAVGGRLSDSLVFRARLLSTLLLTFYMAAHAGLTMLTAQYVRIRLMPEYIPEHMMGNMSSGHHHHHHHMSPCTENKSDPEAKASAELQVSQNTLFQVGGNGLEVEREVEFS